MRRAQLSDRSSSSSVTNDEYMDTDSDGNSYGTEPTIFNSDADSNANNDAHSNADSTAESENAYKASTQV